MNDVKVIDKRSEAQPPAPKQSAVEYAMSKGASIDVIERMWELQLRAEANEARKDFFEAVSEFKKEPVEVLKDKLNSQTNSKYATVGNLLAVVNPILGRHGLSASFDIDDKTDPKLITVTCKLSHKSGHTETAVMSAEPDTSGAKGGVNKTMMHGRMSTLTYLMRATYTAVVGVVAINDHDDDGNAGGGGFITEEQVDEIDQLMVSAGYTTPESIEKFMKWAGYVSVAAISIKDFGRVKAALNDVIKGRVKK